MQSLQNDEDLEECRRYCSLMLPKAGVFMGGFAKGLGQRVVILAGGVSSHSAHHNVSDFNPTYSKSTIFGITVAKVLIFILFLGIARITQKKCCQKQSRIRNKIYFV